MAAVDAASHRVQAADHAAAGIPGTAAHPDGHAPQGAPTQTPPPTHTHFIVIIYSTGMPLSLGISTRILRFGFGFRFVSAYAEVSVVNHTLSFRLMIPTHGPEGLVTVVDGTPLPDICPACP